MDVSVCFRVYQLHILIGATLLHHTVKKLGLLSPAAPNIVLQAEGEEPILPFLVPSEQRVQFCYPLIFRISQPSSISFLTRSGLPAAILNLPPFYPENV